MMSCLSNSKSKSFYVLKKDYPKALETVCKGNPLGQPDAAIVSGF
jgi:hypothetical protein